MSAENWTPAEPAIERILSGTLDPSGEPNLSADSDLLANLARGDIPAIILRQAFDPRDCLGLIDRFIDRGLVDDPRTEGSGGQRLRIDIGTSLGNRGSDQEAFFAHAEETRALFEHLFDGYPDPVNRVYEVLSALAAGKKVATAYEPDGRTYGPAIFRIHYAGHRYQPHIDHVSLREKRFNYAVTRFKHQFAGVLCMQNTAEAGQATQSILHRCAWSREIQPHIEADTFYDYASDNDIQSFRADLEPGDLYFFNTGMIHEVPALEGDDLRVVLAVFIGYSEDDPEIFVWA